MATALLRFQDEAAIEIEVAPGETVAEAAIRQEAPLRTDCLSGTCGACLGHCEDRGATTGERAAVVTVEEAAEGLVATCQTRLVGNARFAFDYPLEPRASEATRLRGQVVRHDRLCETVSRLWIELDDADGFHFQPGQYLRLRPPGARVARAYSIASTVADLPRIELLIRHLDNGIVSEWLKQGAGPGDRVVVQAPLGGFAADDRARRQVFIAGGTGLAPVLSMIRSQAHEARDLLLCFGCTKREELFYHDELAALEAETDGLEIRIALMSGAEGSVRAGTALAMLRASDIVEGAAYHLCGPPAMVHAASTMLRGLGVPGRAIRSERFIVGA